MDIFGLSNIYIDSKLRTICHNYLGIYSSDNIPSSLSSSNGTLICNLSPQGTIGSHFITIILAPKAVYYIDSLGRSCSNSTIKNFLKMTNRPIFFQSEPMQLPHSSYCGFYCMLVVTMYALKNEWRNPFRQKNVNNDLKCLFLLSMIIRELRNTRLDP